MSAKINDTNQIKRYLEFGMRLSVTIKFGPKDEYSLQCNLVGLKEGQFLILDLSQKSVEDLITRKTSNVGVVIRGITDTDLGHIIAFKSQIISVVSRPTWLMFIRLPYNFETKPIRTHQRFKLKVPAMVTIGDEQIKGTLRDLSASGCGIYFDSSVEITKESEVQIKPELSHFPETAPKCSVVNVRRYSSGTFAGIMFDEEIKLEDELKLEVLEHMLQRK